VDLDACRRKLLGGIGRPERVRRAASQARAAAGSVSARRAKQGYDLATKVGAASGGHGGLWFGLRAHGSVMVITSLRSVSLPAILARIFRSLESATCACNG